MIKNRMFDAIRFRIEYGFDIVATAGISLNASFHGITTF